MNKDIKIEFDGRVIEITHPAGFQIEPGSMDDLWGRIAAACEKWKSSSVLVVADAPKRAMGTMDAFGSGIKASEVTAKLSLALCFRDYEPDDLSEFFKTVARNRGVYIEFFADREAALKWLDVRN